jgi:hypothetical protein
MNRVPGSVTELLLMGLQTSGTKVQILITWPNGTTWQFLGHVKGYETVSPVGDRMTATCVFKVDGTQTVTIPSPAP